MKLSLISLLFLLLPLLFLAGCVQELTPQGAAVAVEGVEEVADGVNDLAAGGGAVEEESTETAEAGETEEVAGETHTIQLVDGGFSVNTLAIDAGDTVVWSNERTRPGQLGNAMIIGTQRCQEVRSSLLSPGETFTWTFSQSGTCLIVDGIYTEETLKIIVE